MKRYCNLRSSTAIITLLLAVSQLVLAKIHDTSIPWYSPVLEDSAPTNSPQFAHHFDAGKRLLDVKEVEGQGICLQNATGHGQICQKAHKLGEFVQLNQGELLWKNLNESFGLVNYNYINSKEYCDRKNIIVIQEEEHLSNIYEQSFEVSLNFGDFGQIKQSPSQLSQKAIINQEVDEIFVNMDQFTAIQKYLNDRIFDFWDNATRFESIEQKMQQEFPKTLRMKGSCDGLSKKLPPLDLTFFIYPADNYFQDEVSQVLQRKKVRIHSRHLLKEYGDYCYFGIAAKDSLNDTVVIGQPLLRGHDVVFVHDLPPLTIIQPKKGEKFDDKEDGADFVPPVNPYNRPADYPNNKKKNHHKKTFYDSLVDQFLGEYGLQSTIIGETWHWIEKNNKSQIVLIIVGVSGAFIVAGSLSLTYLAIVLEIIAYLYSQNVFH